MYGTNQLPNALPPNEVYELFLKAKNGDEQAKLKIKEHNLRLVVSIANKYPNYADQFEDLVSVGNIGLMKAVDTFDCERSTKFSTYAGTCINNEILMYIRNTAKKSANNVSFDDNISYDKDGNALKVEYILEDVNAYVEDIIEHCDIQLKVKEAVMLLSELEKRVIILRYYSFAGTKRVTQAMTANQLGYSRSYISRIEASAKSKIKKHVKESGYM
jgi:RNA polymerase sporulation-specific sigma factor